MASDRRSIGIGMMGLGNVGSGVARILHEKADVYARQIGYPLELRRVLVRDAGKARNFGIDASLLTTNAGRRLAPGPVGAIGQRLCTVTNDVNARTGSRLAAASSGAATLCRSRCDAKASRNIGQARAVTSCSTTTSGATVAIASHCAATSRRRLTFHVRMRMTCMLRRL